MESASADRLIFFSFDLNQEVKGLLHLFRLRMHVIHVTLNLRSLTIDLLNIVLESAFLVGHLEVERLCQMVSEILDILFQVHLVLWHRFRRFRNNDVVLVREHLLEVQEFEVVRDECDFLFHFGLQLA